MSHADADIERLAFCLVGMAMIFFHGKCVVNAFCPELLYSEAAINTMIEKLVSYAKNIISSEALARRKQ